MKVKTICRSQGMARLKKFNEKFVLNYDSKRMEEALMQKLINSPEEVKFHLECCAAAFDQENGLRYLPHPHKYLQNITKNDIAAFVNLFRDNVSDFVDQLNHEIKFPKSDWLQNFARRLTMKSAKFEQLLHFTLCTCDLTLSYCVNTFPRAETLWMVECSPEKEKHFAAQAGPVTYLIHRTYPECMYSIVRNGIMSMSNEQYEGFRTHGACCGPGIYLSTPSSHNDYGSVVLCYAVKDAHQCQVNFNSYVVHKHQMCLRAILWSLQIPNQYVDRYIIECVTHSYHAEAVRRY